MSSPINRREFLHDAAAGTAGIAAAAELWRVAAGAEPRQGAEFASRWHETPDRVWPGPRYWTNPLQDWRVAGGRLECIEAAPDRNAHLLTRQLGAGAGEFRTSVRVGRVGGGEIGRGAGSVGFRVGIQGPLREYRNSLLFGTGLDAGLTSAGGLFFGDLATARPGMVDLGRESVELRLQAEPRGDRYRVRLSAHDGKTGALLGEVGRDDLPADRLVGNLALVANFLPTGARPRPAPGKAQAKAKARAKAKDATAAVPVGTFWFADWRVDGAKVEAHDDRAFGPILFSQYTLSGGVLKLTAQMPPLGRHDSPTVRLQVWRDDAWATIAEASIHPEARTATFRVERWEDSRDVPYRLAYALRTTSGPTEEHHWAGTVRRDPVDAPVLSVADVSCNAHYAFPNAACVAHLAGLDPDLLAFTGDQFYEPSGGYGTRRAPLEAAILDLLRKWFLHGWTWRELMRDRPSVSIPDDHDVYQGNLWGEAGAPETGTQEMGGYEMPPTWVNVVHRTQTAHHPDPFDPTPARRGISVYYGPLTYGRVSFAILADRQFKSGPEGKVPPTGDRGDHVVDPDFDPATADLPGLELLGERQLAFLRAWGADWRGADMKAVISQTIFTAMATTHGGGRERLRADYDTNGWPQAARNAALRELRRAFAFHIAGDQHLPAVVHYGIDAHRDAGVAFAGPTVNNLYPRWWEPGPANRDPAAAASEDGLRSEFRDSFGHPLTVRAVANPARSFRRGVLEAEQDKASGLGVVRFDKRNRTITIDCWPFLADPSRPGTQFPGWPVTVSQLDNDGRAPVAHLPMLEIVGVPAPVVRVAVEPTDEVVYSLRVAEPRFRPFVFAEGRYRVTISDPETGRSHEIRDLVARKDNPETLRVILSAIRGARP
ncbi:MAG TPA: alkaline phosphatase D family protein [Isosphaeraceae bacterium]